VVHQVEKPHQSRRANMETLYGQLKSVTSMDKFGLKITSNHYGGRLPRNGMVTFWNGMFSQPSVQN
jgi:hypothetical protein